MIKVIHIKSIEGTKEESRFPNMEAWEQHQYFNNPNFENIVEDITEQLKKEKDKFEALAYLESTEDETLAYLSKKALGKATKKDDDDFELLENERESKREKLK